MPGHNKLIPSSQLNCAFVVCNANSKSRKKVWGTYRNSVPPTILAHRPWLLKDKHCNVLCQKHCNLLRATDKNWPFNGQGIDRLKVSCEEDIESSIEKFALKHHEVVPLTEQSNPQAMQIDDESIVNTPAYNTETINQTSHRTSSKDVNNDSVRMMTDEHACERFDVHQSTIENSTPRITDQTGNQTSENIDHIMSSDANLMEIDDLPPLAAPQIINQPAITSQIDLSSSISKYSNNRAMSGAIIHPELPPKPTRRYRSVRIVKKKAEMKKIKERAAKLVSSRDRKSIGLSETQARVQAYTELGYTSLTFFRLRKALQDHAAAKAKLSGKRYRKKGGGRKPILRDHEPEIKAWIMQKRDRGEAVSLYDVIDQVRLQYKVDVTYGWMQGFMKREKLSYRAKTSNKMVNTEEIQDLIAQYRVERANMYLTTDRSMLWNMVSNKGKVD